MSLASRIAAVTVAAITLAACQTAPPQPMTGADVRAAFLGNTQHGRSVDGDFVTYIGPNGAVRGKLMGRADTGTAQIADDGGLCIAWRQTMAGKPLCWTVQRAGSGYVLTNAEGVTYASVTLTPGNSDGL